MFGPVSGTGRAMMASLQQAMQKGMPPDQAIQYVKSMATQGVAPMADLYAMMNQFQRLKQQQVKPPQTPPTIRDQLNILDQQQQMQRDTTDRSGGLGSLGGPTSYAGQQEAQPMDRGLGAIDAGRMEYPQFAGGGIVAFSNGGTSNTEGLTPQEEQELAALEGLERESMAPFAPGAGKREFGPSIPEGGVVSLYQNRKARLQELRAKQAIAREAERKLARERAVAEEARRRGITLPSTAAAPTTPSATALPPAGAAPTTATGAPTATAPTGAPGLAPVNYDTFGKYRTEAERLRAGAQGEADLTAMQRASQMQKDLEAMGIGEATRKRGEYLTKREAEAEKDLASDKRMALAQAGFAMAEAASRRGRERTGFLGAAAIGGTTGTKLYQAALKENRALKDSIAQNRFALEQAQEMIKIGNYRDGVTQARQAKDNLANLNQALATNELGISKLVTEQRAADRRLGVQTGLEKERIAADKASRERQAAIEEQYRKDLIGLKRGELNEKQLARIALIPDKEEREKQLLAVLGGIAGGEDVEDLVARYK